MKSKYGNKKTVVDGIQFDSKKEAERYKKLLLLEKAGVILDLQRQFKYEISPPIVLYGRKRPARVYVADFVYGLVDGKVVVEDCKGVCTETYKLKRHMMRAQYGIEILET